MSSKLELRLRSIPRTETLKRAQQERSSPQNLPFPLIDRFSFLIITLLFSPANRYCSDQFERSNKQGAMNAMRHTSLWLIIWRLKKHKYTYISIGSPQPRGPRSHSFPPGPEIREPKDSHTSLSPMSSSRVAIVSVRTSKEILQLHVGCQCRYSERTRAFTVDSTQKCSNGTRAPAKTRDSDTKSSTTTTASPLSVRGVRSTKHRRSHLEGGD